LLVSPLLKTLNKPPSGGASEVQKHMEVSETNETVTSSAPSKNSLKGATNEYVQLQRRVFKLTLVATAISVCLTTIFVGFHSSISLLIGALSGLLYLRLLARSIGRLGVGSTSVSNFQLLVPVILFLAVTRLPQLELLPSLLGFLLYKPSLIIQFLLEPRA